MIRRLAIDATGLKIYREGKWTVKKHGTLGHVEFSKAPDCRGYEYPRNYRCGVELIEYDRYRSAANSTQANTQKDRRNIT